jgi:hypothetical protein
MGRALACFGADVGGRLDWTAKFPFRWNLGDEMDACSPWRVFNTESVAHRDAVESGASISSPEYSLQEARGRPLTVEANPRWLAQAHPSPRCAERTALFDRLVGEARKERRDRQRSLHTAARMRRGTRSLSRVARALKRLSASHPSWESWLYLRWRGAATAANREGTFCPADRQLRIPCARMNHDCF